MTKRSGSSRSYEERIERGQPNRTFSLSEEIDTEITALARALGITRSQVVTRGVELLSHTVAPKSSRGSD